MNDALQRLRAVNPVRADPGAPPIEDVRMRIAAADEPVPARRPARRWSVAAVTPIAGALAVAAVVAGVVLVIGLHSRTASSPAPVGGMRGTVSPYAAGLDGDTGWVWFSRCLGKCDGVSDRRSNWLATTTDGGDTWTVARRGRLQIPPVSGSAQDKWAGSVGDDGGGGVVVTHNGGSSWEAIHVPHSPDFYSVSVAGGEAWAVGSGCSGICGGAILRGPASGSRLSATTTTPRHARLPQIVAVSATSAYLYIQSFAAGRPKAWVTADSGRSWRQVAVGCASEVVTGSQTGAIWRSCVPRHGHPAFGISTDAGRHWVYRPSSFSTDILYPASARIAWAQTLAGATMRTTDGGRTWHTVFGLVSPYQAPNEPLSVQRAHAPTLSVQSATAATETIPVTHTQGGIRRTNLVTYRTTDSGADWQRTEVPLPAR